MSNVWEIFQEKTKNCKTHANKDIPVHGQYVESKNLITQEYVSTLDAWSEYHKMKLHKKKT